MQRIQFSFIICKTKRVIVNSSNFFFQTAIPFVTEFLPAIVYYILSMFGLEIGIYVNAILVIISFQPLLNGCTTLIVVTDYRRAVKKIIFNFMRIQHGNVRRVESNPANFMPKSTTSS